MSHPNFLEPYENNRFHQDDLPKVKSFYEQIKENNPKQTEVTFRFYSHEPADASQDVMV